MNITLEDDIILQALMVEVEEIGVDIEALLFGKENPELEFAVNKHRTFKGNRLDFKKHAFLIDLYKDPSSEIIVKKPTQVGLTEWIISKMFKAAFNGHTSFTVLPKQKLRDAYVDTRINPLLTTCYFDMLKNGEKGNLSLKKLKHAYLHFVGSNSETEMVSHPADQLIIDELDFCDSRNLPLAENRLDHSNLKHRIYVSTPTLAGVGIDRRYVGSDKKKWHLKCEHCGKWQTLNFFGNVLMKDDDITGDWIPITGGVGIHCVKCGGIMNRFAVGEYIAEQKSDPSGYHIPALCHPTKSIKELYKKWIYSKDNEYEKQIFMNNDLGECYAAEGSNISQNSLDNCKANYNLSNTHINVSDRCVIGIDVGKYFHVIVGRVEGKKLRVVVVKKLLIDDDASIVEIFALIKKYGIKKGVIDARPENKLSNKISEKSGGIIWTCDYSTKENATEIFKEDKEKRRVVANRTWSIDDMVEGVRLQNILLPMEAHTIGGGYDEVQAKGKKGAKPCGEFYSQLQAPTRIAIRDSRGLIRYSWQEGSEQDHYFHALNYCNIAKLQIGTMTSISENPENFQPQLRDRDMMTGMEDFDSF
ncbi:MAG: hypothetical protein HOG49_40150 [Candidatus Scalindua sp.]|nr:hypothetical protein [Candidatus Scalindua sp.]